MALTNEKLAELDNVKKWLKVPDNNADIILNRLIESVSSLFVQKIGKPITDTYTEKYDGNGSSFMFLPNNPVQSITSLVINTISIPERVLPIEYGFLYTKVGIQLVGYSFTCGYQNVEVEYDAGYADDSAELKLIEQAVIDVIAEKYRGRDNIGMIWQGQGGQITVKFNDTDLTEFSRTVINQFQGVEYA